MELRKELEAGADAGGLARNHTIREGLDHHDGLLTLNKGTQFRYGPPLFEAARKLVPGEIGGPVELEEGYSRFQGRLAPSLEGQAVQRDLAEAGAGVRQDRPLTGAPSSSSSASCGSSTR